MEFLKKDGYYCITVDGKEVGIIYKDESKNYNFNHIVKLNFQIQGYNNKKAAKNWKQAKQAAIELYNNLMEIRNKYGKEIIPSE